jgi:hypothetical protein
VALAGRDRPHAQALRMTRFVARTLSTFAQIPAGSSVHTPTGNTGCPGSCRASPISPLHLRV